ncbi:MAG TPA: hypothetical protein VKG25_17840 [Bryobacteraceae bacterium]|nr:hypothetical protein [Bryobacteraceae bacterium]
MGSKRLTRKTWVLTALVVFTQAFGNLALSWGMKHQTQEFGISPVAYVEAILTPWVAIGVALLVVWLLTRMLLLSWADLSFVLPVTSIGYVLSAVTGKLFFLEEISWRRWLGISLVVAGTVLVGLTRPGTTEARQETPELVAERA